MVYVRLIVSPNYTPYLGLASIERLFAKYGVKVDVVMDLGLEGEYYYVEMEEEGVVRRAVFHVWHDAERAIESVISGKYELEAFPLGVAGYRGPLDQGAQVLEV
ncbi:MAG: hypothetical protein ACP5HQ_00355 [Thermoprotei archaeon]